VTASAFDQGCPLHDEASAAFPLRWTAAAGRRASGTRSHRTTLDEIRRTPFFNTLRYAAWFRGPPRWSARHAQLRVKPNGDDVRDSPALNVAAALQLPGAQVRVHDPEATENARAVFPTLDYTTDVIKACEQADLALQPDRVGRLRELEPV
jgi:hypothetical protein